MPYLERDGANVFYTDSGRDGPAVVFSHGIFMDHSMFDAQVAALGPDYRCVSWDARGHGETETEGSYSFWDQADDLIALMDHL
ncbi:MAG: alpha/beta hydrolase, partial [Actinomycetota bacterium]|nr:alpha/beta hydrolase [Actinomycetota bacterium]